MLRTYVTMHCPGGLRGATLEDEGGERVPSRGAGEMEVQDSGASEEAVTKVFAPQVLLSTV